MASPLTEKNSAASPGISILGYILVVIRAVGIMLAMLICLPFHGLIRLFGLPSGMPQIFLRLVAMNGGAIIKAKGQRLEHDVFYVSNHISWFDIPVIAGATGCTFIANDGIASWPIIGWLCRINKTIFVSREDRMNVGSQVQVVREAIEERYPITVFPEGTTSNGRELLRFKPSLFAALVPPPKAIKIQPILLSYGDATQDIAWVGDESAVANAMKLFSRFGIIKATLHFLEPFDPAEYGDRKSISAEAERRISTALSASLSSGSVV